jgi:hypothetical protein
LDAALRWLPRSGQHPARQWAAAGTLLLGLIGLVAWLGTQISSPEPASPGRPEAELTPEAAAKRAAAASLALGTSALSAQRSEPALEAFDAALSADPELRENVELLRGVRVLVDDPVTRDRALELVATRLGAPGVDLLFDVWLSTNEKTPATRAAKNWLDSDAVRAAASPAAKLAFAVREAKGCNAFRELLPRARADADERSLRSLERLRAKSGCGFLGLEDCYSCLRWDGLEPTLSAVRARPAPRFDAE